MIVRGMQAKPLSIPLTDIPLTQFDPIPLPFIPLPASSRT